MNLVSEADAEAALTERDVGWVVEPGKACELARTVTRAAGSKDAAAERATGISTRFDLTAADYRGLIRELLKKPG